MDKDDLWIVEHFSELVTNHAGKYIAVVNERWWRSATPVKRLKTRLGKWNLTKCPPYFMSRAKRTWRACYRISLHAT